MPEIAAVVREWVRTIPKPTIDHLTQNQLDGSLHEISIFSTVKIES